MPRRACECDSPLCLNCGGACSAGAVVQGKCQNCHCNRLAGKRKQTVLGASGSARRHRTEQRQLEATAAALGQQSIFSLRGGSEIPNLWVLAAMDNVQVTTTMLADPRYTDPAALATLGAESLCCMRTFGAANEPECGFNCLFGQPTRHGYLRLNDCRRLLIPGLAARRAHLENWLEQLWTGDDCPEESRIAFGHPLSRQQPANLREWLLTDEAWQRYHAALRNVRYSLSVQEVLQLGIAHRLRVRVWVEMDDAAGHRGIIRFLVVAAEEETEGCPVVDVVRRNYGHYERAFMTSHVRTVAPNLLGEPSGPTKDSNARNAHTGTSFSSASSSSHASSSSVPAEPTIAESEFDVLEYVNIAGLAAWLAAGLDRRPHVAHALLDAARANGGWVRVNYSRSAAFPEGRRYATQPSLQNVTKEARAAAVSGKLLMLDCVNIVPTMLSRWAQLDDALMWYVAHRAECIRMVAEVYNVLRADAKQLFLALCNGGGVAAWRVERRVPAEVPDLPFLTVFRRAADAARAAMLATDPAFVQCVRAAFPDRWRPELTASSYFLGRVEDQILTIVCDAARAAGLAVRGLIFDGVLLGHRGESTAVLGPPGPEVVANVVAQAEAAASHASGVLVKLQLEEFPVDDSLSGMVRPLPWQAARTCGEKQVLRSAAVNALQVCAADLCLQTGTGGALPHGWAQADFDKVRLAAEALGRGAHVMPHVAEAVRSLLWNHGVARAALPSKEDTKSTFRCALVSDEEILDVLTHDRWMAVREDDQLRWVHTGNDMQSYSRANASTGDCPPSLVRDIARPFTADDLSTAVREHACQTLLLRGAWGSSKTTATITYLATRLRESPGLRVVVLTYRKSLARELAGLFGRAGMRTQLYSESVGDLIANPDEVLLVQFDSLHRFRGDCDIVWIDELAGTLRHTESPLIFSTDVRCRCLDTFFRLAGSAVLCVGSDRGIGRRETQWAKLSGITMNYRL
jgi:hypothetical protein